MKLIKSSMISNALVLLTLTAASASPTAQPSQKGLMKCGRYYYVATALPLKQDFAIFNSEQPAVIHFTNKEAEAVCGGDIIDLKEVKAPTRGIFYQSPRFMSLNMVQVGEDSIFNQRSMTAGKSYQVACGNSLQTAKAVAIHQGAYAYVRLSFKNPIADQICGGERFHEMTALLDRTEALK